jgi:tetratricopeptide (TPR) repeat protein
MLTSTYPFWSGLEDNSQPLAPGAVTLAAVLKDAGYRTAAFVGGFVLDKRFGLDQGFDFYDSPFDLRKLTGRNPGDVKRLGEAVVQSAERWIEANAGAPFFVFLHLYDLHTPYNLPPELEKRFGPGYDGELAYVDDLLGRFWKFLQTKQVFDKALIVFTSDHGEGLGDHGESTHGYFIYQTTLRVPLLVTWPSGSGSFRARVEEPLALLDLAPTMLQFLGLRVPPEFQGRSFLALVKPKSPSAPREVYGETLYSRNHFGTSALHSLRVGRHKFIEAPRPELYDLSRDPMEQDNLFDRQKALALGLRDRLQALRARYHPEGTPDRRAPSAEVVEQLASLGYAALSGPRAAEPESDLDPKDAIADFERYHEALVLAGAGERPEAVRILKELLGRRPELVDVRISLAQSQRELGQHFAAVENLRRAVETDPLNPLAHFNLAGSYFALRQHDLAVKEAKATLAIAPHYLQAEELLGTIYLEKKDYAQARVHYGNILKTSPDDFAAHYNLGGLALMENRWTEAEQHLAAAVKADPDSAGARHALGSLHLQRGNLEAAANELAEAIRLEPGSAQAHFHLGLVFREQRKFDQAMREFRAALGADPRFAPAREELRRLEAATK